MGVYVKGIKMLTDNTVLLRIYPKGDDGVFYVEQLDIDGDILHEYWALPVPPHGRLIDADELVADIKGQAERLWTLDSVSERDYFIERNEKFRQSMFKAWCESLFAYLDTRPTIIEREVAE